MIIRYTIRASGDHADASWNFAWLGFWAFAEIGLGIIVICVLTLPKFVESKGKKVRLFFSSMVKPFTSYGSLLSHRWTTQSKTQSGDPDVEDLAMLDRNGRYGNFVTRHDHSYEDPVLPDKAHTARSL